jgi:hypothetical protein
MALKCFDQNRPAGYIEYRAFHASQNVRHCKREGEAEWPSYSTTSRAPII